MISWDKLHKPKSQQGLGLCKMEVVNQVFQRKLAWKILTGASSLWVHLYGRYVLI